MDESSSGEDESIDDDEDDETQANPPLTRSQYAQQRLRPNVANATAENMFSINNMQLIQIPSVRQRLSISVLTDQVNVNSTAEKLNGKVK